MSVEDDDVALKLGAARQVHRRWSASAAVVACSLLAGLAAAPAALADAASDYAQFVLASHPTAYYQFNDPHGSVSFADSSGNGNTAQTDGPVPLGSPGPLGPSSAYALIDTGEMFTPALSPMQRDNERTVEVWFKTSVNNTCILDAGFQGMTGSQFDLCLTDGNQPFSPTPGAPGLYLDLFNDDTYLPDLTLADGNWHYVAVTILGSVEEIDVDGRTPDGSLWNGSSYLAEDSQPFVLPGQPNTSSSVITIPCCGLGYFTAGFTGDVAELAVYPSALTPDTLNAHFHQSLTITTQPPFIPPGEDQGPSPAGTWGMVMTTNLNTPVAAEIDAFMQIAGFSAPRTFIGTGQALALLSRALPFPALIPDMRRQTFSLTGQYTLAGAGCSIALPCVALSLDRFGLGIGARTTKVTLTGVAGCRAHVSSCWSGSGSDSLGGRYQWIACRGCLSRLPSKQLKRIYGSVADFEERDSSIGTGAGLALGIGGLAAPPVAVVGIIIGAAAWGEGIQAGEYRRLAEDPPDPNYHALVVPALPPRLKVAHTVPAKLRRILQRWLDNSRQETAQLHALRVTLERVQGATAAQDGQWTVTQLVAAARFAHGSATALRRETSILRSLRKALRRTPRLNPKLSAAEARRAQRLIRQHGLPAALKKDLTRLGATKADLARLRSSVLRTPARKLSGSVFGRVTSSARISQLLRLATALDQYGATVAQHPVS
jgi:hypothetical protein